MSCDQRERVQLHLDGELAGEERRRFLDHVSGCAECAAELALYERVFAMARAVPLFDPPERVTHRVLARVLPSRMRRRAWIRRAGFAYAGVLAVVMAAAVAWALDPRSLALLSSLGATASHRLIQMAVFALNSGSSALLQVATGWGLVSETGARLAPVGRALAGAIGRPGIIWMLWLGALAFMALLWWMRPRRQGRGGGMRHVGVLGF
jgi:predicted anti-sigma-YlaC factor YlaD